MMMLSLWKRYRFNLAIHFIIMAQTHFFNPSRPMANPHTLLLQVNEPLMDNFNTVAGFVPILKTYIREVGAQYTHTNTCMHVRTRTHTHTYTHTHTHTNTHTHTHCL